MQHILLGLLSSNISLRRHPLELRTMGFLRKPFLVVLDLIDVEVGLEHQTRFVCGAGGRPGGGGDSRAWPRW
jgi:hypothetical protein